jgi:hypothetical protein
MKEIFVLAKDYGQFKHHYPKQYKSVVYLHDITQLYGHRNFKIERVGTWWELDSEFLKRVEQEEYRSNL